MQLNIFDRINRTLCFNCMLSRTIKIPAVRPFQYGTQLDKKFRMENTFYVHILTFEWVTVKKFNCRVIIAPLLRVNSKFETNICLLECEMRCRFVYMCQSHSLKLSVPVRHQSERKQTPDLITIAILNHIFDFSWKSRHSQP